jgi:hypothetical protein
MGNVIDNIRLPVEAPAGPPNVRPNAALDQHPTGVLIGTLPWLSSLDAADFPCCGTIKFCIPGIGCSNEMEFNLAGKDAERHILRIAVLDTNPHRSRHRQWVHQMSLPDL